MNAAFSYCLVIKMGTDSIFYFSIAQEMRIKTGILIYVTPFRDTVVHKTGLSNLTDNISPIIRP